MLQWGSVCGLQSPESCGWASVTSATVSFWLGEQSLQDPCLVVPWEGPRDSLPLDRRRMRWVRHLVQVRKFKTIRILYNFSLIEIIFLMETHGW